MPVYLVRTNCEYTLQVEAATEDEAIKVAQVTPFEEEAWSVAWSPYEIDPEETSDDDPILPVTHLIGDPAPQHGT